MIRSIWLLYAASDLILSPSVQEAFGLIVLVSTYGYTMLFLKNRV